MKIDLKRFSENLYLAAGKKDVTLSEVARRTGISLNTVYKIFDGKKAGRLDTFLAIANALETDYSTLLDGVAKDDV